MCIIQKNIVNQHDHGDSNPAKDLFFLVKALHDFNVLKAVSFFMPPKELWEAYSNRTVRPSASPVVLPASCPVHISYIL